MALLLRDLFHAANRELKTRKYHVALLSAGRASFIELRNTRVGVSRANGPLDYLLVPPMDDFRPADSDWRSEIKLLRLRHQRKTVIASCCLGAFLLAASGLLDGREATTHWRWSAFAAKEFPDVHWRPAKMLCDQGDVITAGGFLAMIDLALYLVEKTTTKKVVHELAQVLLADSIRQKQSVYAQSLLSVEGPDSPFGPLEKWIQQNLRSSLEAKHLARIAQMSLRSFHRRFVAFYGTTPNKYVQLKRIERAQELLRNPRLSLEQIVEAIGLSDVTSFRKVFVRELGLTPSEFRRRLIGP
jgi:transcriptional regulator GlxA family with amidase domain